MPKTPDEPALDIADPATWPFWMNTDEIAQVLRVTPKTVDALVKADKIPMTNVTMGQSRPQRRAKKTDVMDLPADPFDPARRGPEVDSAT